MYRVPPFVNAANRDFRIDASSPAAWAVNGRTEHDTTIRSSRISHFYRAHPTLLHLPPLDFNQVNSLSPDLYNEGSPLPRQRSGPLRFFGLNQ